MIEEGSISGAERALRQRLEVRIGQLSNSEQPLEAVHEAALDEITSPHFAAQAERLAKEAKIKADELQTQQAAEAEVARVKQAEADHQAHMTQMKTEVDGMMPIQALDRLRTEISQGNVDEDTLRLLFGGEHAGTAVAAALLPNGYVSEFDRTGAARFLDYADKSTKSEHPQLLGMAALALADQMTYKAMSEGQSFAPGGLSAEDPTNLAMAGHLERVGQELLTRPFNQNAPYADDDMSVAQNLAISVYSSAQDLGELTPQEARMIVTADYVRLKIIDQGFRSPSNRIAELDNALSDDDGFAKEAARRAAKFHEDSRRYSGDAGRPYSTHDLIESRAKSWDRLAKTTLLPQDMQPAAAIIPLASTGSTLGKAA